MSPPVAKKPLILINRGGLYDAVSLWIDAEIRRGYTRKEVHDLITYVPDGKGAVQELARHFGANLRLPEPSVIAHKPG